MGRLWSDLGLIKTKALTSDNKSNIRMGHFACSEHQSNIFQLTISSTKADTAKYAIWIHRNNWKFALTYSIQYIPSIETPRLSLIMKGLNVTKSEPQENRLALGTNVIIAKQKWGVELENSQASFFSSNRADCPPFLTVKTVDYNLWWV